MPFEKVFDSINNADIGVVPAISTEHQDHTIPHKLFQYLACRLPVIVSDCKPLKRYVEQSNSGLVFKSGDSKDFAYALNKIFTGLEKCSEMSKNAEKFFNLSYNWDVSSKSLVKDYKILK